MTTLIAEHKNSGLTITSTKKHLPLSKKTVHQTLPAIKQEILPTSYDLSLVFIGGKRSRTLNKNWKGKDKQADVLSFPYSKNVGEIFICPDVANKNARQFGYKPQKFYLYLFIHGCFHLKGMVHGSRMEQNEARIRRRFKL